MRLVVDGMNVIGSRPDGWWRDRAGAMRRLAGALRRLADQGEDDVLLVLDGRPVPGLPEVSDGGVTVLYARRPGRDGADDRIVEVVAGSTAPVEVVTADRALRARVRALGASVSAPAALLARLNAFAPGAGVSAARTRAMMAARTNRRSSMLGWVGNVEDATLQNGHFRRVLFTGGQMQLTVMSLQPGEEIGLEKHDDLDQFLRIEQGSARVTFGRSEDQVDEEHDVEDDWAVIVPGGIWHNVINTGSGELKLYSLYAPPEHPEDTVHETKAEADAAEHDH